MIAIMFHSAGLDQLQWRSQHISDSLEAMRMKLETIADLNLKTIWLSDFKTKVRDRSKIALTFDDGYLDNWVHIFPMLAKYNQRATIFVTTDFVDPRDILRSQVHSEKSSDDIHQADGCCAGFLSWTEMKEMEKSGLIDIQSHAKTHTWYFKSHVVVDFWQPGSATIKGGPVWMLWNKYPNRKPYYLTEANKIESEIPYGTPIYEHGKSLEVKRFIPNDKELIIRLTSHVKESGNNKFFIRSNWRQELEAIVKDHMSKIPEESLGKYETHQEYLERVRKELSESKSIIEEKLDKEVTTICWPGGGVIEEVLSITREVGYKSFTLPSKWRGAKYESIYADMIPRVGSLGNIKIKRPELGRPTRRVFSWYIKACQGRLIYNNLLRANQIFRHILLNVKR
jgi:hypothetical protein